MIVLNLNNDIEITYYDMYNNNLLINSKWEKKIK